MEEMDESNITQRAAEWFIAHRASELTARERADFSAWLKSSPIHVREYLAVAETSRECEQAARTMDAEIETLLREAMASAGGNVVHLGAMVERSAEPTFWRGLRRPWGYGAAAVIALVCVALTAMAFLRDGEWLGLPRTYQTAHAEQTTWRLPDGSVMHLNSDTRVTVRYSNAERLIALDRGQAHFQVAKNAQRRFRVATDSADVIAIGTSFDVYRKAGATLVTVVEGKVAVVPPSSAQSQPSAGQTPSVSQSAFEQDASGRVAVGVQLTAGQRVEMDESAAPLQVPVSLRESTAWLQREIVFEQRPLADVAEEFNRYARTPIDILDPQLRELRLSGAFNAYDTDSFIAFLQRLDGVVVNATDRRIEVHR